MPEFTAPPHGRIPVLRSAGQGATELAAFHAALAAAGLGQYNLVQLSSVVPPRSAVDATGAARLPEGAWGDRLYCVYAKAVATRPGACAVAGLGWVERLDGLGGFFAEHVGESEAAVAADLQASLADIAEHDAAAFGRPRWAVQSAECTGRPVCALVIAPYACEPWAARP